MEVSGQLHAQPLYPQGKAPVTHWIGGWVAPRPVWTWWWREKFPAPARTQTPDPPDCSPVFFWGGDIACVFKSLLSLLNSVETASQNHDNSFSYNYIMFPLVTKPITYFVNQSDNKPVVSHKSSVHQSLNNCGVHWDQVTFRPFLL